MSPYVLAAVLFAAVVLLVTCLILLRRRPRTRLVRISRHRAAPSGQRRWPGAGSRVRRFVLARPRRSVVLAGSVIAALGALFGGPVAAVVGGLYAMVAVRGWQSREARRAVERAYAAMLAAVDAAASDLRAGLVPDLLPIGRAAAMSRVTGPDVAGPDVATSGGYVPTTGGYVPTSGGYVPTSGGNVPTSGGNVPTRGGNVATSGGARPSVGRAGVDGAVAAVRNRRAAPNPVPGPAGSDPSAEVRAPGGSRATGRRAAPMGFDGPDATDPAVAGALARLEAAYRISGVLGTPLADLLDRVDADLRAQQRLRLNVQAQLAGAQATSVLLAALPVVGLALGGAMGFDPVAQLLHTPVGGACAVLAALLQCSGLAWTGRLVRGATAGVR